ncbi:MAG: flagellar hook-basal body complex protein FliE [Phycisphaeraceae bacterium]|nr:flagellar hook-basal body complex protein FliE [Phycisphaeraceae bacterium]MBX3366769.1 flagellar hook-basal body complex protein FliE [Phycisphaeraceae bacterium]
MSDPLGLIRGGDGFVGRAAPNGTALPGAAQGKPESGPSFRDVLMRNIEQVNELQKDATLAIEQLQTGERQDVEGVILATHKADLAFRALQSVRNRMMDALEEVKQMRV